MKLFLQDLIKISQENYLAEFSYKILARFFISCKKSFILVQDLQDSVQHLASLARKILARFEYFLHDDFYWDGTHEGPYMEGMDLNFTPALGRRLLRYLGMFGPMSVTSGTHS